MQLRTAAFSANQYRKSNLWRDFVVLMDNIKNSNGVKILSHRLNGMITISEVIRHFIEVMNEVFK